jgi:mannose-6-phosphate isomerase class I
MANSDNVVRGGLTPKLKDKETLYSMLPYETVDSGIHRGPTLGTAIIETPNQQVLEYKAGFEEFHVFRYSVKPGTSLIDLKPLKFHTFSVCIVISGHGTVNMKEFSHDEKLNNFKVEANYAYYMMPD